MPDEIRKVECFKALIPHQVGAGAKALAGLKDAGVNLLGLWAYPKNKKEAVIELIPEAGAGFAKLAKKAGLTVGKKETAFLVSGEDRPGAVAEALAKVAAAGINVIAVKALASGGGRFGAGIFVAPADVRKAAKALGA